MTNSWCVGMGGAAPSSGVVNSYGYPVATATSSHRLGSCRTVAVNVARCWFGGETDGCCCQVATLL